MGKLFCPDPNERLLCIWGQVILMNSEKNLPTYSSGHAKQRLAATQPSDCRGVYRIRSGEAYKSSNAVRGHLRCDCSNWCFGRDSDLGRMASDDSTVEDFEPERSMPNQSVNRMSAPSASLQEQTLVTSIVKRS